jgi:molybdenum cofactor cytidylyltransferase
MILVCDQPFVKSEHIQSLIQLQKDSRLPMAACFYVGIVGTPALFHQSMFPALLDLNGEKGAKKILNEAFGLVAKLNFEEGVMDIDTEEDYQKIIQGEK